MISTERVLDIENRIFEKIRQLTVDKENEGTTLRRRFSAIDKFNLGIIDFVQFRKVLHELGFCFSDDELKAVFLKFTGGNDKLVYSELCDYFKDLGVGLPPNLNPAYTIYRKHPDDLIQKLKRELLSRGHFEIGKLRAIFEKSDKDKSGSLTRDEFVWALKEIGLALTKTDYDKLFRHFDRNMDNKVSYKEFLSQFIRDLSMSRMQHIEDIYRRLSGPSGAPVTFDRISECFDPRNDPEVAKFD
jgi:Ca2+-binding EF-hand superfamily protein